MLVCDLTLNSGRLLLVRVKEQELFWSEVKRTVTLTT